VPDLHGWLTQQIDAAEQHAGRWHDAECASHDTSLIDATVLQGATLCDCDGPAAALRRVEADRRILARHRLDPDNHYEPACLGCGTYGYADLATTDNLNECPELLDLAHAHGMTPDILATLDRPEPPARPPQTERTTSPVFDSLRTFWLGTPMSGVPAALRGPNWPGP
jgi:hypothetical protein